MSGDFPSSTGTGRGITRLDGRGRHAPLAFCVRDRYRMAETTGSVPPVVFPRGSRARPAGPRVRPMRSAALLERGLCVKGDTNASCEMAVLVIFWSSFAQAQILENKRINYFIRHNKLKMVQHNKLIIVQHNKLKIARHEKLKTVRHNKLMNVQN